MQKLISNPSQSLEVGIAVLNKTTGCWLHPFVLVEGEKRVRLDVHDSLINYEVHRVSSPDAATNIANDFRLSYS